MLIPLGHEQRSVRRLPWVTFAIMGLCVVVFLLTFPGERRYEREAGERLQELFRYFVEHPYLDKGPRFQELFVDQLGEEEAAALTQVMKEMGGPPPESERLLRQEQEHFDRLVGEFFGVFGNSPLHRWGLVPASFRFSSLISHQFIHAGWMHLLGNLFILFLAGPFIEDVWGRPLFGAFYLTAGGFAGIMFAVRYPGFEGPLIGASGAIAGVMGAFLIRYWQTKIKFFYWFFFFFMGTFEAAAWIMLPLWFLKELFFAQAMDVVVPGGGGGGVAFWAHVWGFAFGLVVALAISYFRVEERLIHPTIESKITLVENTGVEQAMELAGTGNLSGGIEALGRELRQRPENVDAAMAMWSLCLRQGEVGPAVQHMVRAVRKAARDGDDEFVLAHWEEVLRACEDLQIPPDLGLRVAEAHQAARREKIALDTLELTRRSVDGSTPAGVLLRMARLGIALRATGVGLMVEAALAHPEVPAEARAELEAARAEIGGTEGEQGTDAGEVASSESEAADPPSPVEAHTLQVMQAIPRALGGENLEIEVNGTRRQMVLGQVQAVAVGGISREGRRPVVLVDLLLDSPWGDREALRTIRLTSDSFDPRQLVGGEDAMRAFHTFLDHLLEVSEAVPLPDPDAARGRPFRSFATLEDYQREVLAVEEYILSS